MIGCFIEEAIALDPKFAEAYCSAGLAHSLDVLFNWSKSPKQSLARAEEMLDKGLTIDPSSAGCHANLSIFLRITGKHEEAVAAGKKAVDLAPNSEWCNSQLGAALVWAGRYEESIQFLKKATRLDPLDPGRWHELAAGYISLGQCEEAIRAGERSRTISPNQLMAHIRLTEAYILCGHEEEALHPVLCLEIGQEEGDGQESTHRVADEDGVVHIVGLEHRGVVTRHLGGTHALRPDR